MNDLKLVFAMCAQGNHDVTTKYGMAGIITAIVCFPCGLLALLYVFHLSFNLVSR